MLRALLTRFGLTRGGERSGERSGERRGGRGGEQLELGLAEPSVAAPAVSKGRRGARRTEMAGAPPGNGAAPQRSAKRSRAARADGTVPPRRPRVGADDHPTVPSAAEKLASESKGRVHVLLATLRARGLRGIDTVRLTQNRSTVVSFRGSTLRVHEAFVDAPGDVHDAIVRFVVGRGTARSAAKRAILAYRLPRPAAAAKPPRREAATHPDDAPLALRLSDEHARLNVHHFRGELRSIPVHVSRRMKSRLGHYASRAGGRSASISISRRHIRRHGWREAFETLLHEMVHQWQEENALALDHGPAFRRKAREVGVTPRARRVLR